MTQEYIELDITALAHDGRGIGRVQRASSACVVFVRHALPGQRVQARICARKKQFMEAECTQVLTQGPDVQAPHCAHAAVCGGCPLQCMPYEQQTTWKHSVVEETLMRIGKCAKVPMLPLLASPKQWQYRNKMEFAFGHDATGSLILGQRARASHRVVATPQCQLMPKECLELVDICRTLAHDSALPLWQGGHGKKRQGVWRYFVVRKPYESQQMVVTLITAPVNAKQRQHIAQMGQTFLRRGATGFVHEERRSALAIAQGERLLTALGDTQLHERLGSVSYTMHHDAFFQINTPAAQLLCDTLERMAMLCGEEILWDLYCGVGAPGLTLAPKVRALYGVEINAKAAAAAQKNAQAFAHCVYEAGDARCVVRTWPKAHVVLVDPPRAGLHPETITLLLEKTPKQILYVSCNPATLARDVAALSVRYTLDHVQTMDFFPQTPHVESCVALRLR